MKLKWKSIEHINKNYKLYDFKKMYFFIYVLQNLLVFPQQETSAATRSFLLCLKPEIFPRHSGQIGF